MRHATGIFVLLLLTGPAAGQTEETRRVEPVVVTATKIETPVGELGASVTVVNGDDVQTYHYSTIDDALRTVPGVEIRRSGSVGKISSVFIRGANSNQVQVLVDGVRVKSPTTGQLDLTDISPDLIERIEIIRGPQSTLYGADAIGGVVNIITRKGAGPLGGSVELQAGNYDTLAARASAGGAYRLLDYSFSASHLESNGQFKNDGTDLNALNARVGLSLPAQSSLSFVIRYNKNETGLAVKSLFPPPQPVVPVIDPNQKEQSETLLMTLEGRTRPVPWWESRVRLSRYTNEVGFQDAPDPGFVFESPFRSQIDVERREVEWVNAFHLGAWSTSTIGLEYRREQGEDKGVFRAATETWSALFEEQLRFFQRLFLTAGFRVEDHSVFGTAATGRGSIAYLVKEWGARLHGSAGSGFRAPTINDLFFPNFSNPALHPEHSLSWDAGVGQRLWQDRVRLDATYFHTDFRDLIQTVPLDVFPFATVDNAGRARVQGLEVTAEADLWYNVVASASYTFTDSKNLDTGNPLPRIPKHSWNIGVTWEPIRRLSLFAQLYVRSRQFDNFGNIFNSGYTRVDVGGTYKVLERYGWVQALEITARVQNLFNDRYAEVHGFPALGTNFLLGVRARF
jgi:vitamin B12 transporter